MKTLSNPVPHLAVWVIALTMAFAGTVASLPALMPARAGFLPKITTHTPAKPLSPAHLRPLTFREVVAFLGDTFHTQPVESGPTYARFVHAERQPDGTVAEVMRMAVRSREESLNVVFSFREYTTMNYVSEFIEGPFFTRSESEQLYRLLYTPAQPAWNQVGRFQAKVAFSRGTEEMEASFDFATAASAR